MAGKVLMRVFSLFLVFFIGFFSCIGAIVGVGYYTYSKISYDKLVDWGLVAPNDGTLFDPEAEVPVTSLTLSGLMEQIAHLRSLESDLNLDYMINRYGVKLPEAIDEILVEELRTLPLNDVLSENGIEVILENVSVGTVLKFVPDGVVSEPAKASLQDKTLKQVTEGNLGVLLSGVKLGYLLGVEYRLDGSVYIPVFADPASPTLVELLAPIDLGSMLTVFSEGGDMLEVLHDSIADVALIQLVDTIMSSDSDMIQKMLEGKSVGEVIVWDEELGAYTLEFLAIFDGMLIGELMDLVPVYAENDPTKIISWTDSEGDQVVGYMRGIASYDLSALVNQDGEPLDETAFLASVYFGDLLSYVPYFDADGNIEYWTNIDGGEIDSAFKNLAMKPVNELMDGGFSIATLMEGLYLGDILGYTAQTVDGERVWYDGEELVEGMNELIANLDLEKLLDPESDYDFMSVLDGKLLGDVLGYTCETVDGERVWYDGETRVSGMDEILAGLDLAALLDSESDYDFVSAFDGKYLGDVLGYTSKTIDGERVWYDGETRLEGMDEILASVDMAALLDSESDYDFMSAFEGKLMGDVLGYEKQIEDGETVWYDDGVKVIGIDGVVANIDLAALLDSESDYSVSDAFDGVLLGEALGYEKRGEDWYDGEEKVDSMEGVISDIDMGKLLAHDEDYTISTAFKDAYIGDLLGYERGECLSPDGTDVTEREYEWFNEIYDEEGNYVKTQPVSGVAKQFANYNLYMVMEGEQEVSVDTVKISEILSMHSEEYILYLDGEPVLDENGEPMTTLLWFDDEGVRSNGIVHAIAEEDLGHLHDMVDHLHIYDVIEYLEIEPGSGEWYQLGEEYHYVDGEYTENRVDIHPVSGIMCALADLEVSNLSDNSAVSERIQTIKVGDAMGWHYDKQTDTWYEVYDEQNPANNKVASGTLGVLANSKIGTINDDIKTTKIGVLLGYVYEDGVWYTEYDYENESGTPVSGALAAIVDFKVNELDTKIDTLEVGKFLGYRYDEQEKKWYQTVTVDGVEEEQEVGGIMASIAGFKIGTLSSDIETLQYGKMFGWEYHGGDWYEVYNEEDPTLNVKATGLMLYFADLTVNEMTDTQKVNGIVQSMYVGDAMGWYLNPSDNKWYETEQSSAPVDGIMQSIAAMRVSELNGENGINSIKIGTILGWEKHGETWYEYYESESSVNNKPGTGVMASFADLSVNQMSDSEQVTLALQDVYVGDAMGWYLNPSDNKWYETETAAKPVEGIMQSIAAMKVSELGSEDGIDAIKIGTILGWEKHGETWFEYYESEGSANNKPGTGVMASFADLSVKEMSDSERVSASVQTVKVGDAMGWYYNENDGEWYTDAEFKNKASGTMATLADSPVNQIDGAVKDLTIADALDWRYDAESGKYYETDSLGNEKEVTGIMRVLAATPITGVNDAIQTTKTGELLEYLQGNAQKDDEAETPYIDTESDAPVTWYRLVTVDNGDGTSKTVWEKCSKVEAYVADTKVEDLDTALNELSIGDVVDVDPVDSAKLGLIFGDENWEDYSIPYFFEKVTDILLELPI